MAVFFGSILVQVAKEQKDMASITNRGNSQWRALIRRRGFPIQSKTFETKTDAQRWARQIESEMDRGVFISRGEADSTTLREALERYKIEYAPKLAQPQRVKSHVNFLQKRPLANRIISSIRGKDIADFIREREKEGVGPKTIVLSLSLISRVFEIASIDWGMESLQNPTKRVHKPKLPNGRTRRLETGEEERLLNACPKPFSYVVRFALETAMRREEIATLTWKNVDFQKRTAYLPKTKNGEERTVPLSPTALEILRELQAQKTISLNVFGMTSSAITKAMIQARKDANIMDFRFHDLRHEAISRLFENTDLDVMEIKAISGHKTFAMLARYTHLRTSRLADRLAGAKRTGNT